MTEALRQSGARARVRRWPAGAALCCLLALAGIGRPVVAEEFQDHYIDNGTLTPDIVVGEEATANTAGLARSLRIDSVASLLNSKTGAEAANLAEHGLVLNSQWDTANWGAFTLDASGRTGGSGPGNYGTGQGGLVALRQRAMPFDHGWQIDNSIGNINTPALALARNQARFYLPTTPMRGLTSEWRGPRGIQLMAGIGEPGMFNGIEVPNFRPLGGSTWALGGQWAPAPGWTLGAQHADARGIKLGNGQIFLSPYEISSRTTLATAGWQHDRRRAQFSLIDGHMAGHGESHGAWLDASFGRGSRTHAFGLFHIDPNLSWGDQLIANDVQGGYYRFGLQSRRLLADAGLDLVRSVSGKGGSIAFLTSDMRYQLTEAWGLGGVANLSHSNGDTRWSAQGYVDHRNRWGTGSGQTGYTHERNGYDLSLVYNQTWDMPVGTHLSTSLDAERFASGNGLANSAGSTVLSLAFAGGGQLGRRWSIDGNLRLTATLQGRGAPAINANLAIARQLKANWTLLANIYDSRINAWQALAVTSPLTPPVETLVPASEERGVFLTLRYQHAQGLHFAPLGGAPGGGAGMLSGYVFLDGNENGRMDAAEPGAERITVVLDHKYSVTTDAKGHYEFGAVAIGHHVIEVVMDNLPLPWSFRNTAPIDVEVRTRARTVQDFAATQMR